MPDKAWLTGLTEAEAEELHRRLLDRSRVFLVIAVFAYVLAFAVLS